MKVVKVKVLQLYSTLGNPMDYTVHGILQVKILEWVTVPFSKGSSQPRDQTQVSHTAGDSLSAVPQGKPWWLTTNCKILRDGNTRPPHLSPEKPVCRTKKKLELNMAQWTGSKLERSMSRLYIVTLLFNLYAEYIMQKARLEIHKLESRYARRNSNNLRYAGDTTLLAESKEELEGLLMKLKKAE